MNVVRFGNIQVSLQAAQILLWDYVAVFHEIYMHSCMNVQNHDILENNRQFLCMLWVNLGWFQHGNLCELQQGRQASRWHRG